MPEQTKNGWGDFGIQAAGDAANSILGIAYAGWNDKRQLKQQRKLQDLQIEGNKQMMDYQQALQYDMWQKTNYSAQKEQMQKAGLNPALMYGMGGGGGTTVGSASASVGAGQAPAGGGELTQGMGLQRTLMMAQLKVMDAQANNLNADANAKNIDAQNKGKGGVVYENIQAGTQVALQQVEKLITETTNERAKWDLYRVELAIKRLNEYELSKTVDINIETVQTQLEIAKEELTSATAKAKYDQGTVDEMIKQLNTTGVYLTLRNELTKAQTSNTRAGTANTVQDTQNKKAQEGNINADTVLKWTQTDEGKSRIKKMAADIAQTWQSLRIDEQRMYIQRQLADYAGTQLDIQIVDRIISQIDKMVGFKFSK